MNNWNLENKYALVTGGSKGIGKAIVNEFLELGASVFFLARDEKQTEAALASFGESRIKAMAGDVTDAGFRKKVRHWINENWGALDILVNNAGINIRKPSGEYTAEEYRRVLDINLIAPFEFSRELFPLLNNSNGAAIVNVSSVAGAMDAKTGAPYGMSKSGLLQLSRSLAAEWAPHNIRVNTVSPWFTETPATSKMLADPEKRSHIISRTPLKRIGKDREIAAAVAFLCMNKASYITGQNIFVDGGATTSIL